MIHTVQLDDVVLRDRLDYIDEFRYAAPCWMVRVWNQLPPETTSTVVRLTPQQEIKKLITKEIEKLMAIRTVAESQAPARLFKRGTVSSKQDYADVMNALRGMKEGQALIVDMDAKAWEGVKKPETTFAANLRRNFESKGLMVTAYQSGVMQITVRKATPLDKGKNRKK